MAAFPGLARDDEALAYALAYRTDQVPAPWSGPRRLGGRHHTGAASLPQVAWQGRFARKGATRDIEDGRA